MKNEELGSKYLYVTFLFLISDFSFLISPNDL
jgi:hypothetical protein